MSSLVLVKFTYNTIVQFLTSKILFKIIYEEIPRLNMLILDKVQKYNTT